MEAAMTLARAFTLAAMFAFGLLPGKYSAVAQGVAQQPPAPNTQASSQTQQVARAPIQPVLPNAASADQISFGGGTSIGTILALENQIQEKRTELRELGRKKSFADSFLKTESDYANAYAAAQALNNCESDAE